MLMWSLLLSIHFLQGSHFKNLLHTYTLAMWVFLCHGIFHYSTFRDKPIVILVSEFHSRYLQGDCWLWLLINEGCRSFYKKCRFSMGKECLVIFRNPDYYRAFNIFFYWNIGILEKYVLCFQFRYLFDVFFSFLWRTLWCSNWIMLHCE